MKRKVKSLLLLFIAVIVITGCTMKENLNMKISSSKDVKASVIIAMDDEMIDTMISMQKSGEMPSSSTEKKTYTDKERWEFLESDDSVIDVPDDYTTEKYDKDGFKGYIAEKNLGNIDKLSTSEAVERQNIISDDEDEFFEGKLFIKDGNTYSSNMKIDFSEESQEVSSYESYGAAFDMKLVIEFPRVPLSHNAEEVSTDGKTLSWNLLKSQDVDFTFDFSEDGKVEKQIPKTNQKTEPIKNEKSNTNLFLILGAIGIVILLLIVIVIVVVILLVTKKKPQLVQVQQTFPEQQQQYSNSIPTNVTNINNEYQQNDNTTSNETITNTSNISTEINNTDEVKADQNVDIEEVLEVDGNDKAE